MVKNAKSIKEISLRVVNKIGVLEDICRLLAERGINIEAVAGYSMDGSPDAEIKLVTEDSVRALEILHKNHYNQTREKEVLSIELENKPGALKLMTSRLAGEGIDIKYIYGSACPDNCPSRLVLSSSDDEKALVLFTKYTK
jgi:hypothetical protein